MNRLQDTVIDDDEESCPLCIEEFDLSDKNFKPCPCGYQICQFCFNSLKTTYEKSTCPNCRRPYDESTIQYKIPSAEEFKLDQLNKNKKQAAAKRKETEKREVETSSRRNLAGVRVKQQNLVYVIGLEPTKKDESMLLDTLRGKDYFGQYGDIEKIVVSKAKPGATNQGIGVYVTFRRKEDAAMCIEAVDGSQNGDRLLRAQYGTTKYCSAFLRGESCPNKNCSFLHETGEDGHHISLQNEPSHSQNVPRPPILSQPSSTPRPGLPTQTSIISQPMARQSSRDTNDSRKESHDGSALPPTAGWANANAPITRARRASQVISRGTPSPQLSHATPAILKAEPVKSPEPTNASQLPAAIVSTTKASSKRSSRDSSSAAPSITVPALEKPTDPFETLFNQLRRRPSEFPKLEYDDSWLSSEDRAKIDDMPPMYDLYGGAKRRLMEDKEVAEQARIESEVKAKLEAQATSAAEEALDEEQMAAGSLALGGEPEDSSRSASTRGAIGRPNQSGGVSVDQFANLRIQSPSQLTTSQNVQRAPGLPQPPVQNTAFEMSDFDRRGPQYSQAQYEQISNHQRNGSRYFNNDSKPSTSNRFQGQQQPFYPSGVQGPPPGLPTAGTPPVSGGGMFAHGQGFTNTGFGNAKDPNNDMRGRSGTNTGHELSKRGGVEHLADPSILQARVHQGASSGQGLFGGNQVDEDFPALPIRKDAHFELHSRVSSLQSFHSTQGRSSTPKVPPGFENTHAHPVQSLQDTVSGRSTPTKAYNVTVPVIPALPMLGFDQRISTPKSKLSLPVVGSAEKVEDFQDDTGEAVEDGPKGTEVSLGSPISKASLISSFTEVSKEKSSDVLPADLGTASSTSKIADQKTKSAIQRPTKIEIPKGVVSSVTDLKAGPATSKSLMSVLDSAVVRTPEAFISRPVTPTTATSEVSRAFVPQPRTIRLTTSMIQESEAAKMNSPMTEKSAILPSLIQTKQGGSRRPSLSSVSRSRPSTPSASERLMSQDVSRAGSPPPGGIVGSAPGRSKTKNQQKKDRREKAKKAEEPSDAGSVTTPLTPAVEEVGPIVARQKKQKKSKATAGMESKNKDYKEEERRVIDRPEPRIEPPRTKVSSAKTLKEEPPKPKVEPVEQVLPSQERPVINDAPKRSYTVRDLCNGAASMSNDNTAIQKLLGQNLTSMSKLISEMLANGDLSRDHPWLSPPSFNSPSYKLPSDNRKGQDYLDSNGYSSNDAFGYVYLPQKEKRALYAGHAVSVADTGDRKNDLLRRCLITPNGWVMRHLSAEESERVLELEERRSLYAEEFGEIGIMNGLGVLEQDDYVNLGGGIEELGRFGDRHGVCWVMGDDQGEEDVEGYDDVDDDDLLNEIGGDGLSDETDEDLGLDLTGGSNSMPGAWDPSFSATTQNMPPNTLPPIQGVLGRTVNLRAMDADTLQKRIHEKQKEVDVSRKEAEKAEKALNKRNKEFARWRDAVLKA